MKFFKYFIISLWIATAYSVPAMLYDTQGNFLKFVNTDGSSRNQFIVSSDSKVKLMGEFPSFDLTSQKAIENYYLLYSYVSSEEGIEALLQALNNIVYNSGNQPKKWYQRSFMNKVATNSFANKNITNNDKKRIALLQKFFAFNDDQKKDETFKASNFTKNNFTEFKEAANQLEEELNYEKIVTQFSSGSLGFGTGILTAASLGLGLYYKDNFDWISMRLSDLLYDSLHGIANPTWHEYVLKDMQELFANAFTPFTQYLLGIGAASMSASFIPQIMQSSSYKKWFNR